MTNSLSSNDSNHSIKSLQLFRGEEHQPFYWPGGRPGALLVHGFMGTPGEMRPAARVLQESGWTTEGLLLPGFGAEIDTLFQRHRRDWVHAARDALIDMKMAHDPLIVVGYSMGAAVALLAAAEVQVDGLVLIAPFLQIGTALHRAIFQVVKRLFPNPQPFKKVDFDHPRLKELFNSIIPEMDLKDPYTQAVLRDLRVPARFADQVFTLGKEAQGQLAKTHAPTFILQGTRDEAIEYGRTRRYLSQFAGKITYEEVDSEHNMLDENNLAFPEIALAINHYAQKIMRREHIGRYAEIV